MVDFSSFYHQDNKMTEDFDIEAMLEAPYKKEVRWWKYNIPIAQVEVK